MVICHHFDRVKMAKLSVASIDLEGNLRYRTLNQQRQILDFGLKSNSKIEVT